MEGNESVKDIVRAFAKELSELNKKFMDKTTLKTKPEEEVKPTEKKSQDRSTSIAHVEYCSNWRPPTISSGNDPFESHIGLRQTKQRLERQSQNQEPKKKAEVPGTYIEEEKEEERVIIPTKFQNHTNLRRKSTILPIRMKMKQFPKKKRSSKNLQINKLKPNWKLTKLLRKLCNKRSTSPLKEF
ncbi:hypothetical protein O181_112345 [Austropuccinia psidii MF-1]|uniref:Uncharacterized protein n=1 Tax=Austropuccinia psidii MF-1 TaxID=1389203 RepID=A0A9Q3PTF9_9BASI|nr:hypothetical protein [Austropuccinia psidii MF-1]